MATVRELVTRWGFDIDEKPLHRMEERLRGLKETAFRLGEVLIGVLTGEGGGILGLGIATANAGIEATKMSQSLGVSVQKLQELRYAAKLSNVEMTSLTQGMRSLSLHALHLQQGSGESAMAFARAGISMPAPGESTDKVLMRLSERFSHMADGWQKVGIANQLLGRTGSLLIPFLNKGPERLQELIDRARQYGAILSDETIEAGTKFYETTEEAKLAMVGLKNTIGAALIPELTHLTSSMMEWYAANREVIRQKLEEWVKDLMPQLEHLGSKLFSLATSVWGVVSALGGLDNVFRLVVAGMAMSTGWKVIAFMMELRKEVMLAVTAFKTLSLWKAIATGGLDIFFQIAGAAAAGGLAWWMMSGGSGPSIKPSGGHGGGSSTVMFQPSNTFNFPAVTDPKEQAKKVEETLQMQWTRMSANFHIQGPAGAR